jgi:hypothetical protein
MPSLRIGFLFPNTDVDDVAEPGSPRRPPGRGRGRGRGQKGGQDTVGRGRGRGRPPGPGRGRGGQRGQGGQDIAGHGVAIADVGRRILRSSRRIQIDAE